MALVYIMLKTSYTSRRFLTRGSPEIPQKVINIIQTYIYKGEFMIKINYIDSL